MAKLRPHSGNALLFGGLALSLAACATPAAKIATSSQPEQLGAPKGNIIPGVLVAIRPVTAQVGLSAGSLGVLTALQISPPAQTPNATEFVIQRNDGIVAAIVLPSPAASPGAAMSAANFTVGDQVELITGAQTQLIHSTP